MTTTDGTPIRPVREVVRDHIRKTIADNPGVPAYRLAVYLGISPSTLTRMQVRWRKEARG